MFEIIANWLYFYVNAFGLKHEWGGFLGERLGTTEVHEQQYKMHCYNKGTLTYPLCCIKSKKRVYCKWK